MPTLNEILDGDLGLGVEKTASAKSAQEPTSEIEKLAMQIGLVDSFNENDKSQENIGLNKEAQMSLDTIYSDLFPGDKEILDAGEKTASDANVETKTTEATEQEKVAAAREEAIGERAFDHFNHYVDQHLTKIAADVASDVEHEIKGKIQDNEDTSGNNINPKGDEGAEGEKAMDMAQSTGKTETKSVPNGELKTAALRQAMLNLKFGGK